MTAVSRIVQIFESSHLAAHLRINFTCVQLRENGAHATTTMPEDSTGSSNEILEPTHLQKRMRKMANSSFFKGFFYLAGVHRGPVETLGGHEHEPMSFKEMAKIWPKQTFCIVATEMCERFSYTGMRTVLTLYLINILTFNDNEATIVFHAFSALAYASSLGGSILADGYIGRYSTILWISIVYTIGQILLAISAAFDYDSKIHPLADFIGLFTIALGTGGIKPCVSAFGGDQFPLHFHRMISLFFSVFYFSINVGSTFSSLITPIFRATPCLGQDSCYALAFGVPAILMVVATVAFISGSFWYNKVPPEQNLIFRVVETVWDAVIGKAKSKKKHVHWLDHAMDRHKCHLDQRCIERQAHGTDTCSQKELVEEVKSLVRVTVMMLPAPMFWALYSQQSSRWTIQAVEMDCTVGSVLILPDQMPTFNAVMVMMFIPVFQFIIYPLLDKTPFKTTYLRRMVFGSFLASVSFVFCGMVQLEVNRDLPDTPRDDEAFVSFINSFPNGTCSFTIEVDGFDPKYVRANSSLVDSKHNQKRQLYHFRGSSLANKDFLVTSTVVGCPTNFHVPIIPIGGRTYYVDLTPVGFMSNMTGLEKPQEGKALSKISLNVLFPCNSLSSEITWKACVGLEPYRGMIALCRMDEETDPVYPCNPKKESRFYVWGHQESVDVTVYDYQTEARSFTGIVLHQKNIAAGTYQAFFIDYPPPESSNNMPTPEMTKTWPIEGSTFTISGMGGVFTITLTGADRTYQRNVMTIHTVVPANDVSILWQIPQYVVITIAEILFSISGLEFAYNEAAPGMKSVVQAIWLFTVACGETIIIIVTQLHIKNLAIEMFGYAAAMFAFTILFVFLTVFYYEYNDETLRDNTTAGAGTTRPIATRDAATATANGSVRYRATSESVDSFDDLSWDNSSSRDEDYGRTTRSNSVLMTKF